MKLKKYLIIILLVASPLCNADVKDWVGETVDVTGDVWLRADFPKGLSCKKAEKVDSTHPVKKGEKVIIVEYKKISCAVFWSYDWVKVKRISNDIDDSIREGYIAVFDENGNKTIDLKSHDGGNQ